MKLVEALLIRELNAWIQQANWNIELPQ